MRFRFTSLLGVATTAILCLTTATPAIAASNRNAPSIASAKQVTSLVAASSKIDQLSPTVASELVVSGADSPQRLFPSVGPSCVGGAGCTFGDKTAKESIALFGDSHALMWLPAINSYAKKNKVRVVVFWAPGKCAVALLPSNYSYSGIPNSGCSVWHRASVKAIRALKPKLVLLGERTSDVFSEPGDQQFSDAAWKSALEKTVREVATKATHVAILEDVVNMTTTPQTCLAAYPTQVQQQCSTPFPNTADPGHQQAEKEAATATGETFIKTSSWFCTATCSPIIGNFIPFYDQGHVSATYAEFLSGVLTTEIKQFI